MGLIWGVLAAIGVWALIRLGKQTEGPRRGHWRIAATMLAAVLIGSGAFAIWRGGIVGGVLVVCIGLQLAYASRVRTVAPRTEALSASEAASILGVPVDAGPEAINAAWRRIMARAHPDQGGTEGLAARVNAAKDRLLKR